MALTLNSEEIQRYATGASRATLNDDIDDGVITREDAQAILSAKGDSLESINNTFPFEDDTLLIPLVVESITTATSLITSGIHETITDYNQLLTDITANVTDVVREEIDDNLGHVIETRESIHNFYNEHKVVSFYMLKNLSLL